MSTASSPADETTAVCKDSGHAALVMRIAGKPGPVFVLDPAHETVIGRSGEIDISLTDRLASRRHAVIRQHDGQWLVEDLESRNGTWLDNRRIEAEPLVEGSVVRIGMTELIFQLRPQQSGSKEASARCVIRSGPVGQLQGDAMRRAQAVDSDEGRRGAMLYQASLRLLAARSSQEVICGILELVIEHTAASGVGWFRINSEAALEAVCVVPPGGQLASALVAPAIRSTIDQLVSREGQAVWLQPNPAAGVHSELACIPLLDGITPHAAVVAMAPSGRLRDSDFDLLVGLTTLATAAWDGHANSGRGTPEEELLRPPQAKMLAGGDQELDALSTIELTPPHDIGDGSR